MSNGIDASDWLVDRHIRQGRGEAVAFRTGRRSVSYAELADQVAGVAGWNRADATARTFIDGWTRTGDVYECPERGLYRYIGRCDDLFKVAGEWVSPFEVESALLGLDGVQEVAVVPGLFHGLLRPAAFVVCTPDAEITEAELVEQCRPLLAGFKRPWSIRFVDGLPKTAVGKLQRAVLRDRLAAEVRGG